VSGSSCETLRIALLAAGVFLIAGCGGSGGDNTSQQPSAPNPTIGPNYITSAYGTAKIEFPNGVVITNQTTQGLSIQSSQGNVTVYLPHTGGSADLTVNNPDSPATYMYVASGGQNIYNNTALSLGSNNLTWEQVSCSATDGNTYSNEFMIKLSHSSPTETATINFNLSEGQSITFDVFNLYDLITKGNSNVCDAGDYFDSFTAKANAMPSLTPVSTASCPLNDLGNGNYAVPYNGTCVEVEVRDVDGVGSNLQYSSDGGNTWNSISSLPATIQLDVSSLSQGSSQTYNIILRETVSNGSASFTDEKGNTLTIHKDAQATLNAYCIDGKTGNIFQPGNGGSCTFTDPTQGANAPYTHKIRFTSNNGSGTCDIEVYKNGNLIAQASYPCDSLNHEVVINNNDTGQGVQQIDAKIYSNYGGNRVLLDQVNIQYRVNQAPTISAFTLTPVTAVDGSQIYKYYVNENINGLTKKEMEIMISH